MKLSEAQENILIYLSFHYEPIGSQEIGGMVGEEMRTNGDAKPRGSDWASPKCQSLKTEGLLRQTSDRKYVITELGKNVALEIMEKRDTRVYSKSTFLQSIHRDFEDTYHGYTSWLKSIEAFFRKLKRIFSRA